MSYRARDWRYERDAVRSGDYSRERRSWRDGPSGSYDGREYSSRRYYERERYRDYSNAAPSSARSSYDRRSGDRTDAAASYSRESDARPRSYRRDDVATDRRESKSSRRDTHREGGVKDRDVGYALMNRDERSHVRRSLRRQLQADEKHVSSTSSSELTPRQVVDEFKRAGHFDSIRKQLFLAFQSSEQKKTFVKTLDQFLLRRLEDLSSNQRNRLASQDKRLQHSELNKWIEEDATAAEAFQTLFSALRPSDGDGASDVVVDNFLQVGGKLVEDVQTRLSELIQAERRRTTNSKDDHSESDEADGESVSTPAGGLHTSVTPMGQETPRRTGGRTPAQTTHK